MPYSHILAQLNQLLGDKGCKHDKPTCTEHSKDESWHAPQLPLAVCYPQSAEDVSQIVRICNDANIAMTAFGAGTSVEGQSIPSANSIVIDLSRMNKLLNLWPEDLNCRVEAGMTRLTLNHLLKPHGLFFPIDPGADATLGGMCATRASGTNAVRYGTMKQNVLGLTVVTAQGEIIHTGTRAKKSSAGYDLTSLFIGSEGTLGIITDVTLSLQGIPETHAAATLNFSQLRHCVQLVIQILQYGIPIARIELLDEAGITAVNRYKQLELPVKPTLFLEFAGTKLQIEEQIRTVESIADGIEPCNMQWAENEEDINRLWQARHHALYAAKAMLPNCDVWTTDVCVPVSQLESCILDTQTYIHSSGLLAPIVGHVGDGNFHVLILIPQNDSSARGCARELNDRIIERALQSGGTCTGEHGIGLGKKRWLMEEAGASLNLMKALKNTMDPKHLLNPGKLFDL